MNIEQKIDNAISLMDMNGRFNSAGNATMLENGEFDTVRSVLVQAAAEIESLRAAIVEIKGFNGLRNDVDAYLFEVAEYALGETEHKPERSTYGIEWPA